MEYIFSICGAAIYKTRNMRVVIYASNSEFFKSKTYFVMGPALLTLKDFYYFF